jgi:hypothetical protein
MLPLLLPSVCVQRRRATRHIINADDARYPQHLKNIRLLQVPPPGADELGRPVWSATATDVARSYRRLSVLVHPDKNPGDDAARTAIERLNAAYRALRDAGQLVRARSVW